MKTPPYSHPIIFVYKTLFLSLGGLRVLCMYSRLCPWLFHRPGLEEQVYDDDATDDY